MNEGPTEVDRKLEDIEARLQRIEQTLAAISHGSIPQTVRLPQPVRRTIEVQNPAAAEASLIPVLGRSLIALGGGYFLRALTDSHVVPQGTGVALGLAYVAFWIYMASRQASRERTMPAMASLLIAGVIAFPLIWETSARFHLVPTEAALAILLAVSVAFLAVAWRYGLIIAAWIVSFGAIGCTVGLMLSGEQLALPVIAFTVISALLWHVAAERSWSIVAWPPAAASCVMCVVLQLFVLAGRGNDGPAMAAVALLIVAVLYAAAASAKTLLRGKDMTVADAVLSAVVIVVALIGAARLASTVPQLDGATTIGIGALSVGAYLLALTQPLSVRTARYFAAIAVPCMMIATSIPSTPSVVALVWIIAAGGSLAIAETMLKEDFRLHALVFALAATIASGTVLATLWSIIGIGAPVPLSRGRAVVAAGIVILTLVTILVRRAPSTALTRATSMAFMVAATVVVIAAASQALLFSTGADPAPAAALRSGVIAAAALGLAVLARSTSFRAASSLVYPTLGLGAAKFAVDDLMHGHAATLFITFAVYGCTLLLLARLRKGTAVERPSAPQAAAVTADDPITTTAAPIA